MKERTEQEQQEKLFLIVKSKWRRKVVRIRAVKKITDECFYRLRNHMDGMVFSVQCFFYKLFHRRDEV